MTASWPNFLHWTASKHGSYSLLECRKEPRGLELVHVATTLGRLQTIKENKEYPDTYLEEGMPIQEFLILKSLWGEEDQKRVISRGV